jgi:glycine hydroxymethyltransferase
MEFGWQTIAAIAVSLKLAAQPEFKTYAKQVVTNARVLASELIKHQYKLQTNGTDNHLILWDLRPLKLTGSKVEKICDAVGITINSTSLVLCTNGILLSLLYHIFCRKCGLW